MEGEVPECYICMDNEGVLPMGCGHVLHEECAQGQLGTLAKPGDKFNATPAACGYCRQWLSHEVLDPLVDPTKSAFSDLCRKLVAADVVPGLKEAHAETTEFPINFLDDYVFFTCHSCSTLYYGGGKDCGAGLAAGGRKENRLCPVCVAKDAESTISPCTSGHGIEYCAYKCKFCCSVANWYNGGTNYCEKCNQKASSPEPPTTQDCSCTVPHTANGQNHVYLGCVLCNPVFLGKKK